MNDKVSIIIPVYNVKEYIVRCLESVIHQPYPNIEVICVDDGSTDGSSQILDSYASDNRIKVIHKENTGYGHSMNIGMDIACGDYISILESDDFLDMDAFSTIMSIFNKNKHLDFVKCDFCLVQGKGEQECITPIKIMSDSFFYNRILDKEKIIELSTGRVAYWSAVYKKSFLINNNIRFHETPGASYQDTGFWFQTLMHGEYAYLLDKCFYHYRSDNPGSSMNSREKVYCAGEEYDYIQKKVEQYDMSTEIYPYYVKCRFNSFKTTYARIADAFRRDLLLKTQEDFIRIQKEGKLDLKLFNENENELLLSIMLEPEKLWRNMQAACIKMHQRIALVNRFYIYGAGEMAKFIYRLLSEEEKNKLFGFTVTDTSSDNNREICGIPIIAFNDLCSREDVDDALWIVGVSKLYSMDIVKIIENKKLQNYFMFEGGIV